MDDKVEFYNIKFFIGFGTHNIYFIMQLRVKTK